MLFVAHCLKMFDEPGRISDIYHKFHLNKDLVVVNLSEACLRKLEKEWDIELSEEEIIEVLKITEADSIAWRHVEGVNLLAINADGKLVYDVSDVIRYWIDRNTNM